MKKADTGTATKNDIATSFKKSFDNRLRMFGTLAPNTFLTPISLVRCMVLYDAKPSKPKQDMKMANNEKFKNRVPNFSSLLY